MPRPGKALFIHIGLGKHPLCAVHAMMTFLASRGDSSGPLSFVSKWQPLTRTILTDWPRQIITSAQIPGNSSSHSFLIGAATVAACCGILNQWAIGPTMFISFVLGHWLTR